MGLAAAMLLPGCAGMKQAAIEDAMYTIWNEGDLSVIDRAYAPDIANGVREFVEVHRAVYPDIAIDIGDVVVRGDRIVTMWSAVGTHKDLGRQVEIEGVSVRRIAGGRVVEEDMYYDMKNVYDQLGFRLIPPDGVTPFGPVADEELQRPAADPEPVEEAAEPGDEVSRPEEPGEEG